MLVDVPRNIDRKTIRHERLPERPRINEQVAVIGSGISGLTAAWVYSEAGYNVLVFEVLDKPFGGTSRLADTAGLGAQYPRSMNTALEVLSSSILTKRLIPFTFKDQTVNYLVADTSAVDYDDFLAFYERVKSYYGSLPKSRQLFGPPDEFFRKLKPDELTNFDHIVGGITSQEQLLDTNRAQRTLLHTLKSRDVPIITSTEVTGIDQRPDGKFTLDLKHTNGAKSVTDADIVINAAGWGARELGQQVGDMPPTKLLFRGSRFVEADDITQEAYPYPFKVVDGMFMHFIPRGTNGTANPYTMQGGNRFNSLWANEGEELYVPDEWKNSLLEQTVPTRVSPYDGIELARTTFMPQIGNVTPVDMLPGIVVAFDKREFVKKQLTIGVVPDHPGYIRILPTKYINALGLVLNALDRSLNNSFLNGNAQGNPYLYQIRSGRFIGYIEPN